MDAVLNWLWQGGVVALAMSVMLAALSGARANVRYAVCWIAALVVVALPVLPSLQPSASAAMADAPRSHAIVALPRAWWTSAAVIVAAMAMWASVHLLRLIVAMRAIRRARRRSRPFPTHIESALPHWRRIRSEGRRARLVLSDSVTRAAVLSWGAPLIAVAPSLVRTLDADDLDRVLIHEWAHVQRHDDLVNVLQIALRAVAGWHPALWWIDRRLHIEREIACDEMTVAISGSARSYAECLMKLSSMTDMPQRVRIAPAVFTRSGLRARVVKIVSPDRPIAPVWSRTVAGVIVLTLCVLSAAVGGVTLVEATGFDAAGGSAAALPRSVPRERPAAVAGAASSGADAPRVPVPGTAQSSPPMRQPPPAERSAPSPQPETDPADSRESREPGAVLTGADTAGAARVREAEADGPSNAALESRGMPAPPPQNAPGVTTQTQSAWTAAAAGGSAIGQKSKEAGLATAGAFRRFASRVAGSF